MFPNKVHYSGFVIKSYQKKDGTTLSDVFYIFQVSLLTCSFFPLFFTCDKYFMVLQKGYFFVCLNVFDYHMEKGIYDVWRGVTNFDQW